MNLDPNITILKNTSMFLDVRSLIEYEKGSIPNSINIPILNDDERKKVGKAYKDQGHEVAMKVGYRLVSGDIKNLRISKWKDLILANSDTKIYCMRGGQRSKIASEWLKSIGLDTPVIKGGYKSLRKTCLDTLDLAGYDNKEWLILAGKTGSGKTVLLNYFKNSIDLEGLANHRGSAFGGKIKPQPIVSNVDNMLAVKYLNHTKKILLIEDESRTIGRIPIPESWYLKMKQSKAILLKIHTDLRINNIHNEYIRTPINQGQEGLQESLQNSLLKIRKRLGEKLYKDLNDIIGSSFLNSDIDGHKEWIKKLLLEYYDPQYDYQLKNKNGKIIFEGDTNEIIDYINSLKI